jgi:diguanylate cyclase (GGDEF)-like protein
MDWERLGKRLPPRRVSIDVDQFKRRFSDFACSCGHDLLEKTGQIAASLGLDRVQSDVALSRAEVAGLPSDRLAARLLAHVLIEQTQVAPNPELVDRLIGEAAQAGWDDVRVQLLHCRLLYRSLQGADVDTIRAASDEMISAAQATADEILIGLALSARALFLMEARSDDPADDPTDLLARAVAMIDDAVQAEDGALGVRAIEVPAAYVEIGQALHRLALWELEEEMYHKAALALSLPLPAEVTAVRQFTVRVLVVNRLEGATALACALLEIGQRNEARAIAGDAPRPTVHERADLPGLWAIEMLALERLLDVIAGVPDLPGGPTAIDQDHFLGLKGSTWPGYGACLLLAAALGHHDRDEFAEAAALAEQAVGLLDDYKPSIRTLAMSLAAADSRDMAALRWARHLAELRWGTRLAVLGAVRTRLAAARMLRQGEQLSRQAYADALTGLANRHAQTRHLARLRRRDPRERLAVVLVDVDHFKAVNDTFGHGAGDDVLRVIGAILQSAVRASDLAVRLGGDEFMLLVDLPPGVSSPPMADGIVESVARYRWDDVAAGLRVGVSAGQATGPACEVDRLMRAADDNLYRAKAAGRGRAVAAQTA